MFRHIIYAIFFWQLVNKTADCFNNIVFILVAKISSKKVCEKIKINSKLEKALCNRNAELLRLVEATFDSFRRIRKKNLIILKSLLLVLFVCRCWHLSCQISIVKCSENCNMLTERAVFEIVLNIITIYIFIVQ